MNSIIVDTDAGSDDFMAIAWLLSQPAVAIEAFTVVHGLAHVEPGARNLRRLLKLAGRADIPVYDGEENPLEGHRTFPASWRETTDAFGSSLFPSIADAARPAEDAVTFLKRRLREPARILALGPLTNLALACRDIGKGAIVDVVTMGGAVEVPGNLMDGRPDGENEYAEWNIYCDPLAASEFFALDVPQVLVGLDATNRVPITGDYVRRFSAAAHAPMGRLIADVMKEAIQPIMSGMYYAWDPLAAIALLDPSVVQTKGARIEVITEGPQTGRTKLVAWEEKSNFRVAVDTDVARFYAEFERTTC
jgi:inosine-uridine nucleoside N-ribohydrolase